MLLFFSPFTFIYFFIWLQAFSIESVPLGLCLPDVLWGFDAFYLQFNLSFALMQWRIRDMLLIFIACMSVCAVCDVRTTSGPVLFCHVHSFSCVSCCLTLVFCCDVVELGTYGKLKYYHSMTEEGKPETFHYFHRLVWLLTSFLFCIFPSPSRINTFVLSLLPHLFSLVTPFLLFCLTASLRLHWHKCKHALF